MCFSHFLYSVPQVQSVFRARIVRMSRVAQEDAARLMQSHVRAKGAWEEVMDKRRLMWMAWYTKAGKYDEVCESPIAMVMSSREG